MNKLLNFFLEPYLSETIEMQKKVKSSVVGSITIMVMLSLGAIVRGLASKDIVIFFTILSIGLSFILPLILIR